MKKNVRAKLVSAIVVFAICAGAIAAAMPSRVSRLIEIYNDTGLAGVYYRVKAHIPGTGPNTKWPTAAPSEVGISGPRLEAWRAKLAKQGSLVLLVARNGRLALEWYAPGHDAGGTFPISAIGKAVTASTILLAALSDGLVDLDEPVARYIPSWKDKPDRNKITLRQLVSHSSGIENISLAVEDGEFGDWRDTYVRDPQTRFHYAIDRSPLSFEPGTQAEYSGVAFYVASYALTRALLERGEYADLRSYLKKRVMDPLGVAISDWTLSAGERYEVDNMTLYSIGSDGRYTPRALATVGELFVRGGEWDGRQILDRNLVAQALAYSNSPPQVARAEGQPPAGLGWWVNTDGYFPSLPEDAAVAAGGTSNLLLVVPSEHLVAVWIGNQDVSDADLWSRATDDFFVPLMNALQ